MAEGLAMIASRRNFLFAGASFLAAPSIVRVASLMPVSVLPLSPILTGGAAFVEAQAVSGQWKITACEGFKVMPDGSLELDNNAKPYRIVLPQTSFDGAYFHLIDTSRPVVTWNEFMETDFTFDKAA